MFFVSERSVVRSSAKEALSFLDGSSYFKPLYWLKFTPVNTTSFTPLVSRIFTLFKISGTESDTAFPRAKCILQKAQELLQPSSIFIEALLCFSKTGVYNVNASNFKLDFIF